MVAGNYVRPYCVRVRVRENKIIFDDLIFFYNCVRCGVLIKLPPTYKFNVWYSTREINGYIYTGIQLQQVLKYLLVPSPCKVRVYIIKPMFKLKHILLLACV